MRYLCHVTTTDAQGAGRCHCKHGGTKSRLPTLNRYRCASPVPVPYTLGFKEILLICAKLDNRLVNRDAAVPGAEENAHVTQSSH